MVVGDYLLAGFVAMLTGLDRVALVQVMISRPLVAGSLTGWVLGSPLVGLESRYVARVALAWQVAGGGRDSS